MANATVMTEAAAKGRDCCVIPNDWFCTASRCLGWRWFDDDVAPYLHRLHIEIPEALTEGLLGWSDKDYTKATALQPPPGSEAWVVEYDEGRWMWTEDDAAYAIRKAEHDRTWPARRRGFCGRAGNPQTGDRSSFSFPAS